MIINNKDEWNEMPRPEMMKLLSRHCIAFWLIEYPDEQKQTDNIEFDICGGSAFLWQTGSSKYIVTAHHVWTEFSKRIKNRPDRCLIFYLDGDHAIPIFNYILISEDKDLDLAVLSGSGIENLQLNEKSFFQQTEHPSPKVIEGERLAILGYPKDLRISEKPYHTIGIVYMQGAAIVSEYGTRIRISGNPPHKFRSSAVPSLEKFDLPGASGGPVFSFRNNRIDWVGIVSEVGMAPYFDVVISPSHFIGNDGKIINPTSTQ